MTEESPLTNSAAKPQKTGGEGAALSLLTDEKRQRSDMVLLRRAARGRWGVSDGARRTAQARLLEIIRKDTVEVPSMNGLVDSEGTADNNAIAAVRTLAVLNAQDQADDHHQDDDQNAKAGLVINAAAQMNDRQKIDLYIAAGRPDLLPERLREVATKEGLIAGD